ncbi:hypothetical protein [Fibrobacter sp.]|uniref:hypothetical protein n=1 Tax=Fibrobacter sp. TaxID=35828 RepID=UPI003870D0F4
MRFFSFLLASAAVFYACSSDDGSSANDSAGISDDAGYEHVTVDKDKHTITVSSDAYTIAVSVASEGRECSYEERQVNVTKDNCKDLTTDGLRNYDEDRDFQDSLYLRGTVMFTKGAREFGECLADL